MEWYWLPFQHLSAAQVYAAMRLRQRVFVVEQACLFLDADGIDLHSWHGLGYLPSGELGAYARIVPPGKAFNDPSIGRVVTAPELRGRGAGYELMQQAMMHTAKLFPSHQIEIGAQAHLQQFYARFGFAPVGQLYDEDGISHMHMIAPSLPVSTEQG